MKTTGAGNSNLSFPRGKPCDICGDLGNSSLAATCSQCNTNRHLYCMQIVLWEVPDVWICEECLDNANAASPEYNENDNFAKISVTKPQRPKNGKTVRVKVITTDEAIKLSSGGVNRMEPSLPKKLDRRSTQSTRVPLVPKTPPGFKTLGIDVLYSKLEPNPTSKLSQQLVPPKTFKTPHSAQVSKVHNKEARKVTFSREQPNEIPKLAYELKAHDTKVEKVTDKTPCGSSPSMHDLPINRSDKKIARTISGNSCADAGISKSAVEEEKLPSLQATSQTYFPEATWRGTFEILSSATPGKRYDGFEAHLPPKIHHKALKSAKQMPSILSFKLLPRCSIWDDIFQEDYPDGDDIALYIIPEDFEKSIQHYNYLLEAMELHDSVMCCYMDGGVEFLIFTSKLLDVDFQKFYTKSFLWGLFRHVATDHKQKKPVSPLTHNTNYDHNHTSNDDVDMEIDMIGGVDV